MAFTMHIQDPTDGVSTLLEHVGTAAASAEEGAGAFAFASAGGVDLVLRDPDFSSFLERAPFELVVGVDAVTTPQALTRLGEAQRRYPMLQCHALVHDRRNAIFHPKMAWFARRADTHVIIGSGNLTRGGLLSNWEAFGHAVVDGAGARSVRSTWTSWHSMNASRLRRLDDDEVVARALRNQSMPQRHAEVEEADEAPGRASPDAEVLVAQIPRASVRWNQANFDLDTFEGYLGLKPGAPQRVVLFAVDDHGHIGQPEVRPSVSVKSQNYRLELGLAAGLPYPTAGRPLAVFLRLATRQFRYRLLLPGSSVYDELDRFARRLWTGRDDRMIRVRTSFAQLQQAVPGFLI